MKIEKTFQNVVIAIIVLTLGTLYLRYIHNKPEILFETDLKKAGITREFEFSVGREGYYIGLAVHDKSISWSRIVNGEDIMMDGNYTIEYYKDDKLEKKEVINRESLSELYKNLYNISASNGWKQMVLGQIKEPGDYKIRVTVNTPESVLKDFNGTLYFYSNRPSDKLIAELNNYSTPESREAYRKKRLLENLIDANETNQTLIPLRNALDTNDTQSVKKIIQSDNNITVNTDMVFHRRALDYAAFHNNTALTKYLIDKGADIHHKDEMEKNALAYAIENNATQTAKLLIESGVNVNEVPFVQNYLLNRLTKIHIYRGMVMSALQYTAGNALFEMTELLLKNGMQDNIIVSEGINVNVYSYIYFSSYTTMNEQEQEKMQRLFDKYGVKVENLNQTSPNQIGY
ncbi:ankyrin repeat domain-containing protein [Sulfuricurvum sp.]|uniref:ankyrin repeat domain-containing protein n=1 Tax=Sulfuricurvum sp. TaxID=2025608 RepID=UPI00260AA4AB|nr:ankyrin repeat domain-containing protein [Sulfuricurvum sp.]MDD3595659.1 ankyrin repeat domain-containing protein [Sulfuricurvum sp.]